MAHRRRTAVTQGGRNGQPLVGWSGVAGGRSVRHDVLLGHLADWPTNACLSRPASRALRLRGRLPGFRHRRRSLRQWTRCAGDRCSRQDAGHLRRSGDRLRRNGYLQAASNPAAGKMDSPSPCGSRPSIRRKTTSWPVGPGGTGAPAPVGSWRPMAPSSGVTTRRACSCRDNQQREQLSLRRMEP